MWNLKIIDTDKSLYIAIADALERDIRLGLLKPGTKMPTHRELAKKVGVNVTTITRAYKEAENRGLVTSIVGSGTYISSDAGRHSSLINTEADKHKQIEFGLVLPLYAMEPDIKPLIENVLRKNNMNDFMTYTPPQGLYRHRLTGSQWMKRFGITVDADHVIITAGAQHALNCIFSSIFKPGDRIAVDTLTYPGVKTAARLCGIHLEAVDTDEEGMIPQALSAVCSRHTIKGIYTAAVMQNPTNTTMSSQRRIALANMIEKNNLILVEDDLYRFLSDEKTSTLSQLLPEQSIYIAGISKAFYCGLRISFIAAPKSLCNRIAQAVVDTQWMAPAFNAEIACECIQSGTADKIILQKRAELRKRAALLKEKLSGYTFRYVPDSMFVWLKLPDYWTSREFEKTAGENRLNVISSEKFAVGSTAPPNYIRISLSGADSLEEFENGLGILLKLLSFEIGPATGIL